MVVLVLTPTTPITPRPSCGVDWEATSGHAPVVEWCLRGTASDMDRTCIYMSIMYGLPCLSQQLEYVRVLSAIGGTVVGVESCGVPSAKLQLQSVNTRVGSLAIGLSPTQLMGGGMMLEMLTRRAPSQALPHVVRAVRWVTSHATTTNPRRCADGAPTVHTTGSVDTTLKST